MNIYRLVLFTLIIGKAFAELRICLPIEQLCSIGKCELVLNMDDLKGIKAILLSSYVGKN